MSINNRKHNTDFQKLAKSIKEAIIESDGEIGDQKEQVELVYKLEREFQALINKYQQTEHIYRKFIEYIVNDCGNILSAQPFFREKGVVFNKKIAKSFKKEDVKELMEYEINSQLINFIVENWNGQVPVRVKNKYDKYMWARDILIKNNIPLAINRAKLFHRRTPEDHMDLLDLIGICVYGLSVGVDKYVGEYSKVWRSVCIGRMVGFMIEEYSRTFIRMYPTDRKILYRANSLKHKFEIESIEDLTKEVNKSFEKDKAEGKGVPKLPVTEVHIRTLLGSSSYISATGTAEDGNGSGYEGVYDYSLDPDKDIEKNLIEEDLIDKISLVFDKLTILERKIIRLKGNVL